MRDILSLLLTVFGCIIFIQLLPTLIWLFLFIMLAAFIYTTYQRYKYIQYQKEAQNQETYRASESTTTQGSVKSDVIDVEYTESEEDIS